MLRVVMKLMNMKYENKDDESDEHNEIDEADGRYDDGYVMECDDSGKI